MGISGNPAKRNAPKADTGLAITWASNAPYVESGYGTQTAQVIRRLTKDGHKVAVSVNFGLDGATSSWEGIPLYPRGFDLHSADVIPAHAAAWAHQNADRESLLITLYDVWVYKGKHWDKVPRIAAWVPVDHLSAPPEVAAWCKRDNVTPLAMSRHGQDALAAAGIESTYIPHAIDTAVYKPSPTFTTADGATMTGREFMNIGDDRFVVGMVSANKGVYPNRKSFPEAFLAFAMFAKDHPDAVLYCHTEASASMSGIDLVALAASCGIAPSQLAFPDPFIWRMGIPAEVMASVFSGMDVFLQPSRGEGFGIPLIEAQSCGTPAIVSNATAQPELLGDGWLVDGQPEYNPHMKAWFSAPRVDSILSALNEAYERPRERSAQAREFVSQYDADRVFDAYWRPALKALA